MSEKRKNNSITNKLVTVFLILTVALCLFVVIRVISYGYVNIAGFSVFRVVTGSMEPEISIGSLLISQKVNIDQVEIGDIVCFRSQEADMLGKTITHRVINILDSEGKVFLETKGDANLVADAHYVSERYLIGKVIAYTGQENLLSDIMSFLTSRMGFLICIVLPCLLISGMILRDCVGNIRAELGAAMDDLLQEPEQQRKYKYITEEEYQEMYERIRRELMEELGLLSLKEQCSADTFDELKQANEEQAEEMTPNAQER